MECDLSIIGMKKGMQYETIITTSDCEGNLNAAPIGVIFKGQNKIMCRIFKGSTTLKNIVSQKEFIVNICENPLLFTYSILDKLENSDFNKNMSLKNVDCYFKCKLIDLKKAVKQSDPIKKNSQAIVIQAEVEQLFINRTVNAYNRSFSYVIESLVNFSRLDIASDEQVKYYLDSFKEAYRVIKKVGSKKDKQSIDKIKNKIKEKGYEI